MVTVKVKGKVEAVSIKPGREGLKVDSEWFNATPRTVLYVKQRKPGDAVYMEVGANNSIDFVGDLHPDDPDKVAKIAQNAPKTAPNSPKQAPDGQSQPPGGSGGLKPKLALSQTDRLIVAQVCLKGAIDIVCAAMTSKQGSYPDSSTIYAHVDTTARRLEADFYKRVSA